MRKSIDGRGLYLPRGRDPHEDLNLLADALVASDAELFDQGGRPVWLVAGKPVGISLVQLIEVFERFVATKHLVNRGNGDYQVEYRPVRPNDQELRTMLTGTTLEGGSLVARLPKADS